MAMNLTCTYRCNDVIATALAAAHAHKRAVNHLPTRRHGLHLISAPTIGGLAVEEQLPPGLLLLIGQCVLLS